MVRRSPEARFMGGAWVFPGGAVDPVDESDAARAAVSCSSPGMLPWVAAAIRELLEETCIWLLESGTIATSDRPSDAAAYADVPEHGERFAGDTLAYFANWITPKPLPVRFDTRFFAVTVPPNLDPVVDRIELVDALWIRPPDALELAGAGEWDIAFPTRKILEFLGGFESAAGLLDNIEHQSRVETIQPRLATVAGSVEVLMPGDSGFEEAAAAESDPALLVEFERIIRSGPDTSPEIGSP
jgi:8-oxo-dGTP pyrophosphatase MutT (NUDIX family)